MAGLGDDPRMPSISGFAAGGAALPRRRSVSFAHGRGGQRRNNTIPTSPLEFCLRQDLETIAPRRMAVLDPPQW